MQIAVYNSKYPLDNRRSHPSRLLLLILQIISFPSHLKPKSALLQRSENTRSILLCLYNIICVYINYVFLFFPFSLSISVCSGARVGVCLDVGGHLVRTLLCHLSSVVVATLANAQPRLQVDCGHLVGQHADDVADRRAQSLDTDQPWYVLRPRGHSIICQTLIIF